MHVTKKHCFETKHLLSHYLYFEIIWIILTTKTIVCQHLTLCLLRRTFSKETFFCKLNAKRQNLQHLRAELLGLLGAWCPLWGSLLCMTSAFVTLAECWIKSLAQVEQNIAGLMRLLFLCKTLLWIGWGCNWFARAGFRPTGTHEYGVSRLTLKWIVVDLAGVDRLASLLLS